MLKGLIALILTMAFMAQSFVGVVDAEPETTPPLFISELKIRNDSAGYDEFIELYNSSAIQLDLNNFYLDYQSSTASSPTRQQIANGLLAPGQLFTLAKQPAQIADSAATPFSSLSDTGGTLKLVDSTENILDEVAWSNSATPTAPIVSVPSSSSTKSLSRGQDENGWPLFVDAWVLGVPSPLSSVLAPLPPEEPVEEPTDEPEPPALTCEGVIITELLPNPSGSDTGNEFIELYNPTAEVISLASCSLQTTANSKVYTFTNGQLQPEEYKAYYDTVTGLTLPNSAGGTVWLLSPSEELQAITYDGGAPDDISWALFDSGWLATYQPTPNAANVLLATKPCPAGQVRNEETNRCQTIASLAVAVLAPCQPGQERNLATNRCRSVLGSAIGLVPCKEGQERNPATNRCRSIDDALADCAEGQERNPETNRCRKVGAGGADQVLAEVKDVPAPLVSNSPKWWLAGFAAVGSVGYGFYEWRHDLANLAVKIRRKLPHNSSK